MHVYLGDNRHVAVKGIRTYLLNKELKSLAADEYLRENACLRDFEVSVLEDHYDNPTTSFKNWLKLNFPKAVGTLKTCALEAHIKEVEDALEVEFPSPTELLYRFYDGKNIQASKPSALGLIGGYTLSNHWENIYLSPLKEILVDTRKYFSDLGSPNAYKCKLVAQSIGTEKCLFLNCTNGHLYVGTANVHTQGEVWPCVPPRLIPSMLEMMLMTKLVA
ncbi:hypothetical protein H6P81_017701 [Aristolochia fimbriata]|uniref:Uncharacterized protein n=1 Tax=Aristolochia fimbriata TaxID=158543 RepID=A0AAV7DZE6_ARIFI|nr:hypothetical protein H6P81_017701 [Aristolochia fimbriata]